MLLALALAIPLFTNRDLVRLREYAGLGAFLSDLDAGLPAGGFLLGAGRLPAYYLEHAAGPISAAVPDASLRTSACF